MPDGQTENLRAKLQETGLFTRATGVTIAKASAVDRTGRDPKELKDKQYKISSGRRRCEAN
jgi:hypothetical protein